VFVLKVLINPSVLKVYAFLNIVSLSNKEDIDLLFSSTICIDELSVIIIILFCFNLRVFYNPSVILVAKLASIKRHKPLFSWHIKPLGVMFPYRISCLLCVTLAKQILAFDSWHVPCILWNVLLHNFVHWPTHPVH